MEFIKKLPFSIIAVALGSLLLVFFIGLHLLVWCPTVKGSWLLNSVLAFFIYSVVHESLHAKVLKQKNINTK